MAALYGLRKKLGLADIRKKLGMFKQPPTPLQLAIEKTTVGKTVGDPVNTDQKLIERIINAYRKSSSEFPGYGESMWLSINKRATPMHELLVGASVDAVMDALNHPHKTNLFLGFDNPVAAPWGFIDDDRNLLSNEIGPDMKQRLYRALRRLAEATGAAKIANPETSTGSAWTVDEYLDALDQKIGVKLQFPNFYPEERGILSSRGVISYRPLQAIYQAWRLKNLGANRVVEIGAGLGRTAFYARSFGVSDYTIIDIPLSNVAQGHFLSRALGLDQVALAGEERKPVRLVGPQFADTTDETFDVVLNVDSLSELDHDVARGYVAFALRSSHTLVSINREWEDAPRTSELIKNKPIFRAPYWMRDGYVEEIVTIK